MTQRFLVGVHFRRHFGGPGHLTVEPGALTLANRRATRTVVHRDALVKVERKRFEPPTTNHWVEISDGETTAYATLGRKRTERLLEAVTAAGFTVERA